MAVQRIFLPAVSLHCYFLHPDDLWDAAEEERGPDRSERPPQTGETAALGLLISDRPHTDKCFWLELLKNIFCSLLAKSAVQSTMLWFIGQKYIYLLFVHPFKWFMCFYACSEKGGGQDSVLPGAGLRSVLAAPPPQPHPEAHHLRWERSKPLRTAQVWRENTFPKRKWKDHSIDGWLALQKGLKINVLLCDPFFFLVSFWCWTTSASTWHLWTPA